MIEQVINRRNMHLAYKQVLANKGSAGVDGMQVSELKQHIVKDGAAIVTGIINGTYLPQPILGVTIPKSNGKTRLLGIPTVTDRWLQQAVAQAITPKFEYEFTAHSYGFRPGKNAHQCIQQSQQYINEGYQHIVDIDLKSFFDEVDHCLLLQLLYHKVKCPITLRLIRKWLRAPVVIEGKLSKRRKGVPQGSPLALRTHPQTLSFSRDFRLKGANFKFVYFIKGSIFMINGKITELRTGQTHQSGVCFTTEKETSSSDSRTFNGDVWSITNPGVSLCSASQREQREGGCSGSFCGIYRQATTRTDQSNKEICKLQRHIDQQSGPYSAGRIFSKEGSWQKRRNNLKCHIPMTVYGSKSSLRFIVSLSQSTLLSPLNIPVLN